MAIRAHIAKVLGEKRRHSLATIVLSFSLLRAIDRNAFSSRRGIGGSAVVTDFTVNEGFDEERYKRLNN